MSLGAGDTQDLRRNEMPEKQQTALRKAIKLEWMTIIWVLFSIALVGVVAGQSQAMRSAWIEDMLALVPPIAFLLASRISRAVPSKRYPYGRYRSIAIGHQAAAMTLLVMGGLLIYEAVSSLIKGEKPPIGLTILFGHAVWSGWLMIGVMIFVSIPMVVVGRVKIRLAKDLHDKLLYADADMAKADWGTAVASSVGVLGIGLGFWWADAVAALVISASILKDGITNIKAAVSGLSDGRATTYDNSAPHRLNHDVEKTALQVHWAKQACARVRDQGRVFHAEVFVERVEGYIPTPEEVSQLVEKIRDLDWKMRDVVVSVVEKIDPYQAPNHLRA